MTKKTNTSALGVLWGAQAIADFIGRPVFDSAIPRFESWRPSQLILLRFCRFSLRGFWHSRERSREFFVLPLSTIPIQFRNRITRYFRIARQVVRC